MIPDINMDYEHEREQNSEGGGAGALQKITILCNGTAYHGKYNINEDIEFTMEMELTGDNSARITVFLPDILWNGYEYSNLKALIRIKYQTLSNRAKYVEDSDLGVINVRTDELDKPGGTHIIQTKEYKVWYNAGDGGNIWVGDGDWNEVTNHKNTSEPCEVLAGSFTFEYTETVEGEFIKDSDL